MKPSIALILCSSIVALVLTEPAIADTVSSDNYSVNINTIDTNPQPTPKSEALGSTNVNQKDFTTGPNYTVTTSNSSLSLNISQNIIDYGILSSTNPVIRTSKISLNSGLLGAEMLASENHPLLSAANAVIPDTSCDNGSCTSDTAALWNNTLTYGFGYRCKSNQTNVCDSQFNTTDYFKPYPQLLQTQSLESIMVNPKDKSQASIIYKVNISGTQKTGGYYNSITYLAIPNF